MSGVDNYGMQRWVSFYNGSGEEIPPYGVLTILTDKESGSDINKYRRIRAGKFLEDTDDIKKQDRNIYALNSSLSVKPGRYGKCTFATNGPAWARFKMNEIYPQSFDAAGDHEWVGQEWGPFHDSWSLGMSRPGFTVMARPDVDNNRILVLQRFNQGYLVQYDPLATVCLGPRDGGGLVVEGDGYRENNAVHLYFRNPLDQYFVTLSGRDLNGILHPGQWTWAIRKTDVNLNEFIVKYYAMSGGFTSFTGTTQSEGTLVDVQLDGSNAEPIECRGGVYVPLGTSVHACLQTRPRLVAPSYVDDTDVVINITNFGCGM